MKTEAEIQKQIDLAAESQHIPLIVSTTVCDTFKNGATFGRKLERERILEMLRAGDLAWEDKHIVQTERVPSNEDWADWLEAKLKGAE